MDLDTIRAALGELQEDPDRSGAWQTLDAAVGDVNGAGEAPLEVQRLLHAAASEHGTRGEWEAHSRLLEIEAGIASDADERAQLMLEVGRVYQEELLNEAAAEKTYASILEAQPGEPTATERLSETNAKRGRWKEMVAAYLGEAEGAPDSVYKSSMLMRAAEMEMRFGDADAAVAERLQEAVELDPTNAQAAKMLECFYRRHENWEEAAALMGRLAEHTSDAAAKASALVRQARVFLLKLADPARAAAVYEAVLEVAPTQREARAFLDQHYEGTEAWSDLVALYERDLGGDIEAAERLGDMMQIAMLHWKKRDDGEAAAEWFARILALEPGHPLGLNFFRQHCEQTGDEARLLEILTTAQNGMPDGDEKVALSGEIAKLAEGQSDGKQAIEQYKAVLRSDPHNVEARQALKRLYEASGAHNALVELLRLELERLPRDATDERLLLLWEVAGIYRSGIQSDSALVKALNQVLQIDPDSQDACRELIGLYQTLGRWRELLNTQEKLAELADDPEVKKELYREVGRAWLERNNVQNASKAFQSLRDVDPADAEATERLGDLYRKRRAWPALYELCESTLPSAQGEERLELLREMAQLAGDRLHRADDAIRLFRELLEEAPEDRSALESLERLAEKSKNWSVLAETLELHVESADDENTKTQALQKLAGIYDTLEDAAKAASAWRRILEIQPGHGRALRVLRDGYLASGDHDALEELFLSRDDASGLADVFNGAAERAKETDAKLDLSYRAAALYEDPLESPERAQRCYERILAADDCQTKAASALIRFHEEGEKWQKLPPLYELLLAAADEPEEQLDWLGRLIELNRERLGDLPAALGYARDAYALSPSDQTLLTLEEQASAAGNWEGVAEALSSRLEKADELELSERVGLRAKLADLYATRLDRLDDAVATYRALLTEAPQEIEAADAFEQLLRASRREEDLRWLTELRVENSGSDGERVDRLCEAAALELTDFADAGRAIDLYRRALEVDADDARALSALPALLMAAGEIPGAVAIMERHREHLAGEERAALELELAGLYLEPLRQPEDALLAISAALEAGANDTDARPRVSELLSQLISHESVKTDAAQLLADLCASSDDAAGEVKALQVLLDAAEDADERGDLYARMIDIQQEKLGAFEPAFDLALAAAKESLSTASLWDRADQLAVPAGKVTELAAALDELLQGELERDDERELAERAARLQEDRLGDSVGAVPYLERVLKLDPSSEAAFVRLKDILTGAERWDDLQRLYDRACEATEDPERKMELLSEAALVCEEFVELPEKATVYYERIHEIDPQHDGAISALERLYERHDRHADLAKLLSVRVEDALGNERVTLERRLADLLITKLDQPQEGLDRLEVVLAEDATDAAARDLAEQVLRVASLRPRVACLLETVYETLGQSEDLARILAVRLETFASSDGAEVEEDAADVPDAPDATEALASRNELLRRLAELREDALHDEAGAFEAWAELVPSEPLDNQARDRLVDLARRLGRHEELAVILRATAKTADDSALQGELLMQAARIYEDFLEGADRAEAIYREVLDVQPDDVMLVLPAARALERLADAAGRLTDVADALERQASLEQEGDRRREIFTRLGELYGTSLDQSERAVGAWRTLLEEEPGDVAALAALDRLYERLQSWEELAAIIEQRLEATEDGGDRRDLRVRLASLQAERLDRMDDAVDAWRAVLDENPGDETALQALSDLFETQERWTDLEDALQQRLEIVAPDGRLGLLVALGDLRRTKLESLEGALEVYRQVLTLSPQHESSRAAVWIVLQGEDPIARTDAAALLRELYEAEANFDKLLDVLEREAEAAEDPTSKLEGLEAALHVAEGPLNDPARAWSFAERGLEVAAPEPEAAAWAEHVERLAGAADQRRAQAALLRKVASEIADEELQLQVALRIAQLARDTENDAETATTYFEQALAIQPDNGEALEALESLYAAAAAHQKLHDILERRAELAEDGDRREFDLRRAKLLADDLNDPERATEVYEGLLDGAPEPRVTEALELLYGAQERWDALMELFQRQIDTGVGEPAPLHVRIAEVAVKHQDDAFRAVDELQTALEVDLECAAAVAALEKLIAELEDPELRARAASLLEPVHLANEAYDQLKDVLEVRLAASSDDALARRELGVRLAELHETHRQDIPAALEAMAAIVQEEPTDEDSRAELERLAKLAGLDKRLAEIYCGLVEDLEVQDDATAALCVRTAELLVDLGQASEAVALYRRALEFSPESEALFEAIDALLVQLDRAEERVAHYEASLDHTFEHETRVARLHTLAELREAAGEFENAVAHHLAILDLEEGDTRSLDALTGLFGRLEQWDELVEHLQRRAEISEVEEDAAAHRLELAVVLHKRLDDAERSIDQLEEVMRLVPAHQGALEALEAWLGDEEQKARVIDILQPVYEEIDDWKKVLRLNEERLELAETDMDRVGLLRDSARLLEERGESFSQARAAYAAALELDPEDADLREHFERLAQLDSAWDEWVEIYERIAASERGESSIVDLMTVAARVHDENRDDPRSALGAYMKIWEADQSDPGLGEKIEDLSMMLGDWATMVRLLELREEQVLDDAERADLARRRGRMLRDMLDDKPGATTAFERAMAVEPEHPETLDALIALYRNAEDSAERLAELYERRIEVAAGDSEKSYELLLALANTVEKDLDDRGRAIDTLNQALELKPDEGSVLERLGGLYEAEEQWNELLDNLGTRATAAEDAETRVALRKRMATVSSEQLQRYEDAVDVYRLVLEEVPSDDFALAALRQLAEEHEGLRGAAAPVLTAALRVSGNLDTLAGALELQLSVQTDTSERAETLQALADVLEQVGKPEKGLEALLRALAERPDLAELHASVERLAEACEGWQAYAEVLSARADGTFDAELACDLFSRLGRVAAAHLNDNERAADAYKKAIEQVGEQPELLEALDGVYVALEDYENVADILERRAQVTDSEQLKAEMYCRLAGLQVDQFGDKERGLSSLEQALDLVPNLEAAVVELEKLAEDPDLFEAASERLETIYRKSERAADLALLYQKRVGLAPSPEDRRDLRKQFAGVLEEECRDVNAAQKLLELGLAEDPDPVSLAEAVERLAQESGEWNRAAEAVLNAAKERDDLLPDVAVSLCLISASWLSQHADDARGAESALDVALGIEPESIAVLDELARVQREAGRQHILVATLRKRAALAADDEREEYYRDARDLCRSLNDAALAEEVVREALERNPKSAWGLAELVELREAAGDRAAVLELTLRQADIEDESGGRRELWRSAAALAEELGETQRAIELHDKLFTEEPSDVEAATALERLLGESERWEKVAEVLMKRIGATDDVTERGDVRLRLARLAVEKLDQASLAIELYETLLDEAPDRPESWAELPALYEANGCVADLAKQLDRELNAVVGESREGDESALVNRLASLYEETLEEPSRAIDVYVSAVARHPEHTEWLSALVRLYKAADDTSSAADRLERLLELSDDDDVLAYALELAELSIALDDNARAVRALQRALAVDERNTDVRAKLAGLYEETEAWDELVGLWVGDADHAASTDEKIALLRRASALRADRLQDAAGAVELLERARDASPEDRDLLLEVCDAYSSAGRADDAIHALEQIVESYGGRRSKELADIHRRIANACLARGESERALTELDRAFRIQPGNLQVLNQLGRLSLENNDLKKAQQMFRALLLQKLGDDAPITKAEVFMFLGQVHAGLGEKAKAVQNLESAIRTDPDLERAKELLEEAKAEG